MDPRIKPKQVINEKAKGKSESTGRTSLARGCQEGRGSSITYPEIIERNGKESQIRKIRDNSWTHHSSLRKSMDFTINHTWRRFAPLPYDKIRVQQLLLVVPQFLPAFRLDHTLTSCFRHRMPGCSIPLHGRSETRINIGIACRHHANLQ